MFLKNFYRDIIHNAPIGYTLYQVIYDDNHRLIDLKFVETNPAFTDLTGLPAGLVIGHTITEVLPDSLSSPFAWIDLCSEADQYQLPRNYLQYFSLLNRWFKGCMYVPQPGYLITLFYDVSEEQKFAEEHASIISSMVDIIMDLDRDLKILKVFTGNESLLFLPRPDILGVKLHDLLLEPSVIEAYERACKLAEQSGTLQVIEHQALADGRWFRASIEFLAAKEQVRIVIRDITEQKIAENILETFFTVASDYL